MRKYLYYCTFCNDFYKKETNTPMNVPICARCNTHMRLTGISPEDWENRTEEEKNKIKRFYKQEMMKPNSIMYDQLFNEVKTLSHDVHTMYNVLVFFIVLTIIGIVLWFLIALS